MQYKKLILAIPALLAFSFLLISWGGTGHTAISEKSTLSFNTDMEQFTNWVPYIAEHSSDADERKSEDPDEGPRHYIDIDNYPEFVTNGAISQAMNDMIALHGQYTVYDNGILPWITLNTYDSLVRYMRLKNWDKAKYYAADLSHYVADGHMPMHITLNYDGQYFNNKGIHSRYESTMINYRINQITYTGEAIAPITNVSDYVFNYIYVHYKYVDSILLADTYAQSVSSGTSTIEYKEALWLKSKSFTPILFKNASHAFTELLYNAWIEAGKPSINGTGIETGALSAFDFTINPNPSNGLAHINFNLTNPAFIKIQVMDIIGNTVTTLVNETLNSNTYSVGWNNNQLPQGVYFIEVVTPHSRQVKKLVVNH